MDVLHERINLCVALYLNLGKHTMPLEHIQDMRDSLKVILRRPSSETGRQTFRHCAANALPEGVK